MLHFVGVARWPRSDVHNIILLAPVQKRPSSIQLSYHLPISVRWPVLPGSLSRYLLLKTSRCCRSSAHSSRRHSYRSGEPEPAPEPESEEVNSVRSADYQKVSAFYSKVLFEQTILFHEIRCFTFAYPNMKKRSLSMEILNIYLESKKVHKQP